MSCSFTDEELAEMVFRGDHMADRAFEILQARGYNSPDEVY